MYSRIDLIFTIFTAVSVLLQGYCLQYFLGSFLESRTKSRFHGLYVMAVYGLSRLCIYWLPPTGYESVKTVWKTALLLCMLLVTAMCFYKAFHGVTLFLAAAFRAVADISAFLVLILLDKPVNKLLMVWNLCLEKGIITSEKTFETVINVSVIGIQIFREAALILMLYLSLKGIVRNYREKDYALQRTELLSILTPAVVSLLFCALLRTILFTVEENGVEMVYDKYPLLLVILPAILLLSLLSILYGVKLFQDTVYLNRERSSRIVLEKQIGSMQEHIAEMERVYSGIRSMKHDMKNTLSVVLRLAAKKGESENKELQTYLSELNQTFDSLDFSFKTGNSVIDTLLNMKYHEALRIAPDLQFDVKKLLLPSDLVIRSYDLGVILGNALDNAMEACRKLKDKEPEAKPFIRLSSVRKDNLLIFKIENSFDGTLKRKGQSGLPETDKADKKVHGIGLANIKNTAGNYQGTMDYKIDGRVFILSVMIKNEKHREMTKDYGRLKNDGSTKPPLEISK